MATYLLDTSVIINVINGKRNRKQILQALLQQDHLLACCPINVTEVYAGVRPNEETRTQELLESLEYYPVTWPNARLAGLLNRLTLITDNLRHYPMKELSLYPLPGRQAQK